MIKRMGEGGERRRERDGNGGGGERKRERGVWEIGDEVCKMGGGWGKSMSHLHSPNKPRKNLSH